MGESLIAPIVYKQEYMTAIEKLYLYGYFSIYHI